VLAYDFHANFELEQAESHRNPTTLTHAMNSQRARDRKSDRKNARAKVRSDRRVSQSQRDARRIARLARVETNVANSASDRVASELAPSLMANSEASLSLANRYLQWRTVGAWLLPLFLISAYMSLPTYPDLEPARPLVAEVIVPAPIGTAALNAALGETTTAVPIAASPPPELRPTPIIVEAAPIEALPSGPRSQRPVAIRPIESSARRYQIRAR
jgi:hypothetical protein